MTSRILKLLLTAVGWAIFLSAFVWPTIALTLGGVVQGQAPEGGFTFTGRQWGLLGRSGWLSASGTVLCLSVSLPCGYVIGRAHGVTRQPIIAATLLAVLLCPPMVFAFGWERFLPKGFDGPIRCLVVWALWAWPIPAMVIGAGWSRAGGQSFEAALLSTSPFSAFLRAALPSLRLHVALSGVILFVIFFSDYGVPHACGLTVYATELLGWTTSFSRSVDVVWPALLPTSVTLAAVALAFQVFRRLDAGETADAAAAVRASPSIGFVVCAVFVISFVVPLSVLVGKLGSAIVAAEALRIYAADLACSLAVAVLSGILAVGMGLGVVGGTRLRALPVAWTVVFGVLPGALIGASLIAAYNRPQFGWLYDHWMILALGYIARFGWIGIATAWLVVRGPSDDLAAQARTDGATPAGLLFHLFIPMNRTLLCGGVAMIAALSVADVATSSLVRVPAYNPIAHVVIEKFHRFEDGMLISLSLCLVSAAVPPAFLLGWGLRRRT